MPGLVPGIHVLAISKNEMAGTSPATTDEQVCEPLSHPHRAHHEGRDMVAHAGDLAARLRLLRLALARSAMRLRLPLRGLVMRGQYCRRGPQSEQVEWINGLDRGIQTDLRNFRYELGHARTWIHARIA